MTEPTPLYRLPDNAHINDGSGLPPYLQNRLREVKARAAAAGIDGDRFDKVLDDTAVRVYDALAPVPVSAQVEVTADRHPTLIEAFLAGILVGTLLRKALNR
jgi:hypothetical protein